jgi:hypothetical protein
VQRRGTLAVVDGRYELDRELVRGPSAAIWRARDALLGRTVILEVIRPALADDAAFAERLAFECRRIASLTVPGVPRLLDTGRADGVPFVVRQDVRGVTARELAGAGPLPVERAVAIAVGVLEVLSTLHAAGITHLALAADAVFVGPDDAVAMTGLGIGAAARTPSHTQEDGARADVAAAGAIAFELLTGEPPEGHRSPRELRRDVPRRIDRAVARSLSPAAEDRFPDAASFADTLLTPIAERDPSPRRGVLRAWLVVPVLVIVAAIAVISVGLWVGRLEVGGPLGIRAVQPSPSAGLPTFASITPASATAFDPDGDGTENSSMAPLAIDGDRATAWRSENYFDASLHKPGVGLLFDLGERRALAGFRLWTPHPGYEFQVAVGDDPGTLLEGVGPTFTASAETRGSLSARGRYVLVWITTVVDTGDGNRAEIAEFRPLVEVDA